MSEEVKIKQFGLTVEFSSDVKYHLRDEFTKAIEAQIAAGVADAAEQFEKNFFLQGSNPAETELIMHSPFKNVPHDEKLLPTKDGWTVGYVRKWNCVDIYHEHGIWPFNRKWHFAEKGICPECKAELPSEMWTAINLLVEL